MAKKSQTNARRNNTQAGRRVVNFYNSTIHIDARQNISRTHKTENNGCTIIYPSFSASNMVGDYFPSPDQSKTNLSTEVVSNYASKMPENRKTFSKKLRIAAGIVAATIVVGVSILAIRAGH